MTPSTPLWVVFLPFTLTVVAVVLAIVTVVLVAGEAET